ncbi:hypothetical protein Q0Z83_041010 [Actinoplanes sichuanensis]|uniref:Uncharacterized protein n=1 Tax=Actinoplanes sichuanensis TaxID=512349 RepID=A0ABW4AQC2_9ACTN|nr:hypothetical protein [Actinoplanes sichuanensis]BEL05910.1 hypothetical protein Q0Z83_041010 [Actinoplanes sichuanensis]
MNAAPGFRPRARNGPSAHTSTPRGHELAEQAHGVDALLAEIQHADAGRHNDDTAVLYLRWPTDRPALNRH